MKKTLFGLLAVAFVVFVTSCGKVPQADIDTANKLIDSVRVIGGDVYLPDQFAALQDTMNSINEKVLAQKGKLFRKYDDVKALLATVSTMGNDLLAATEAKKIEVKQQVTSLLDELKALIDENQKLVLKAPKGKEGAAAVQAIKDEITVLETTLTEAASLAESGSLMDAFNKLTAAKEKAVSIQTELKDAIAKVRR